MCAIAEKRNPIITRKQDPCAKLLDISGTILTDASTFPYPENTESGSRPVQDDIP